MRFPHIRPRRLRASAALRGLVRESAIDASKLIQPMFVVSGSGVEAPIEHMPGQNRYSADRLVERCRALSDGGVSTVLLFGVPDRKDATASAAYAREGVVQRAVEALRSAVPELLVITDVCLCAYMDHGHCGVLRDGEVDNDATLELLGTTAVSHARAGAHMVAPSDMMDGRVAAIRKSLDEHGMSGVGIMSYAVKYASSFFGPFREAAGSAPLEGDRRGYQMDPANAREALKVARIAADEGADIVMVKPAMPCLDIVAKVHGAVDLPVAAYQVSGEYAMIEFAARAGALEREAAIGESLLAIRRAGADMIISYFAGEYSTTMAPPR